MNSWTDSLDARVGDALTAWKKLDELDVKILEGLSLSGPRNLALIASQLQLPPSTVRFRVRRMLSNSILFLHLNPYHTNMGLKKAVVFAEAVPGHGDDLLDCLRINGFWVFLCQVYGSYEGYGGIWTIPKQNVEDFHSFLNSLEEAGVAKSTEVIWSTCFQGIPVRSRWFSAENHSWTFHWEEWIKEVETISGDLPYTLIEPRDWPVRVDYEDLLIIKELEKDAQASIVDVSKRLGIPSSRLKYHYREHVVKSGLAEDYQVDIYHFPFLFCEASFFKFDFQDHEKMAKFALSMLDKPLARFVGKVLGEDALVVYVDLPRWEFRRFMKALSSLIKKRLLKEYRYFMQDIFQTWRQTIPYEHFRSGRWYYDNEKHHEELREILERKGLKPRQ